jgi:hypothetical protein
MHSKKVIFGLVFLLIILYSCSIQKRYHRNGFTVNWNKTQTIHKKQKQSVVERKSGDSTSRKAIDLNRSFYSYASNSEKINKDEQQKLNILDGTPKLDLVENSLKNPNLQKSKIERLYSPIFLRKANAQRSPSDKLKQVEKAKSKSLDGASRSLGIAGIFLLIGLIIGVIGALLSIEILGLIALIFMGISGLFFMLFIFEGLLTILTFGML